ncbi:hypothetical protein HS088_TW05G00264 [Tripterygium wilfordii]|uniref:Uncharacterized protein n=1 Tax=Tripterygium wilfordii TaxID=458696 RepID=A0A7J7DMI7_TRIWF|nr:uncharacterized protein LOC119998827 [Tripterygium wilfordii]KAF5747541.1 hypothetical protein HS088_TW05G00264 [Tripterygium wilfordii]
MSRVLESKRRSPSVIARLMGLDGLPPQQSTHKQNSPAETYQRRTASVERARRSGSWRSFRKTSKEEQEFKDVYEVLDSSNKESSSHSSQGASNSKLSEAEMEFVRQKFMEAKRLSTDEKLQDSQEFRDAIELLESNKDLLLKFLQQPNSLFAKHLHDLQGSSPPCMTPQFLGGRISAMKSSHDRVNENIDMGCKTEREATRKSRSKYAQHHDGFLGKPCNTHTAPNKLKSPKVWLEGKDESAKLPTRIVVLKPNLGNIQNSARTAGSPRSPHAFLQDCSSKIELMTINNKDSELWGRKTLPDDMGLLRHKSREISRKIRTNDLRSKNKGYAGDESSPNTSENESAYELGVRTLITRSINSSSRSRSSSSRSTKSSISQEAKKRLSERWKSTHNSLDLGLTRRGSTLAEMLASPDCKVMPANLDTIISEEGFSGKFNGSDRLEEGFEPLGISSRDGWKVEYMTNLSSSRLSSLHASSTSFGSPKTHEAIVHRQSFRSDRHLMPKKPLNQERDKVVRGSFDQREWSASRKSRSNVKKSQVSSSTFKESNDTAPCINLCEYESKSHFRDDASFECDHVDSEKPTRLVGDESYVPSHIANVEIENKTMAFHHPSQEMPAVMLVEGVHSTENLNSLSLQEPLDLHTEESLENLQHFVAEIQSPSSSKEPDQPSPISVLEATFPDDLSSASECFESLSADLHGLRMQLQLLKLESEAYEEGSVFLSSDEDLRETPLGFSQQKGITESRESSYAVTVLINSGINDIDLDTFRATWDSPECPVNPSVFEELEKKYCDCETWVRHERRLLFDRINSALLVIYEEFADPPHPRTRQRTRICGEWIKKGIKDNVLRVLTSQDKKASKDATEMILGKESQWLDLRNDNEVIGKEIEKFILEDLVTELLAM